MGNRRRRVHDGSYVGDSGAADLASRLNLTLEPFGLTLGRYEAPLLIDAARLHVSEGEIVEALQQVWRLPRTARV